MNTQTHARGLTFDELLATSPRPEHLRAVLASEVAAGRVALADDRYAVIVTAFDAATITAVRAITAITESEPAPARARRSNSPRRRRQRRAPLARDVREEALPTG